MRRRQPVELREGRADRPAPCAPAARRGGRCDPYRRGPWVRRGVAASSGVAPRSFRQSTSGAAAGAIERSREHEQAGRKADSRNGAPASLTGSAAAMRTSVRSARRHTVRATCASAAARVPPGRMNSFSAPRSALKLSTASSSRAHMGIGDRDVTRDRQLAAQVEEVVLDAREARGDGVRQRLGEKEAQRRIELVDIADRVDTRRILRHARAVAQAGRAGVARARDDLREAMAHGCCRAECARRVAGQHTRSGNDAARTASDRISRPTAVSWPHCRRMRRPSRRPCPESP